MSYDDLLEQVMRLASEDYDLIGFLDSAPESRQAMVALGRLLGRIPFELHPGCPLDAWTRGTPLDPNWRRRCSAAPGSLWEGYQQLLERLGPVSAPDVYQRLEALRTVS